ncbi:hypothetical protein Tco_1110322 [Tanacetum coccineum]|uniref:Uncharacterized protein n=1 Tax=Tanacetum coccineum TaxID=301880 RepID=A0ABQ5IKZ7_9ASTR
MELCTTLQTRVLDLEKTKTTQATKIASLKRRVEKLEKRNRSRTHKLKRLYKVGLSIRVESSEESLGEDASKQGRKIDDIDANEEITLVNDQDDDEMFDVDTLDGEEVVVAEQNKEVVDAAQFKIATDKVDEITLAQILIEIKSTKPKVKGVVIQEPGTTKRTTISSKQSQDKVKGILVEPEKPMKKKDQISFNEETDRRLQVEFDEEERIAREKAKKELEANIALTKEWDDIEAKIDADHELA